MANRRQIREAAVQLLYTHDTVASDTSAAWDETWNLIHDRARTAFDRARVKVLNHWQQGRLKTIEALQAALKEANAAILAADPKEKLARQFQETVEAETQWIEKTSNLPALAKADTGDWRNGLTQTLDESELLRKKRAKFAEAIQGFPPAQHKAITELLDKLADYDSRANKVRSPEKYPEQRELEHLQKALADMKDLEDGATSLAGTILTTSSTLDEKISQTADNYDLKRVGKVELAILRLGAWELRSESDVPRAVAIDEGIELARAFCGEESAAFINGILDKL